MAKDPWFAVSSDQRHKAVFEELHLLSDAQRTRARCHAQWLSIYRTGLLSEYSTVSNHGALTHRLQEVRKGYSDKATPDFILKPLTNALDTVHSRIGSTTPKPRVLTSGGEFSLSKRAHYQEKYLDSVLYLSNGYHQMRRALKDSMIFDMGHARVYADFGEVRTERLLPLDVWVDEASAYSCPSRCRHILREVSARALMAKYPESKSKIAQAVGEGRKLGESRGRVVTADLLTVVESICLASAPKANDGRYAITINGATLDDQTWSREDFGMVDLRWSEMEYGFYGQGLIDQGTPLQLELNDMGDQLAEAFRYLIPLSIVEEGSISDQEMQQAIAGMILKYKRGSQPPRMTSAPPIPNQAFEFFWRVVNSVFEMAGVSQMSATGRQDANVRSAIHAQTVLDTESARHATTALQWERGHVDLGNLIFMQAKETKPVVKIPGSMGFETLKWEEVSIAEEAMELQVYPVNLFPTTPAGRLSFVTHLEERGYIESKAEARKILGFPDIEQFNRYDLEIASREDVDMSIEKMLWHGEFVEPSEYQNFATAIPRVMSAVLRARQFKAPKEHVQVLEDWIDQATAMDNKQKAALAPPAPPQLPAQGLPPELGAQGDPALSLAGAI